MIWTLHRLTQNESILLVLSAHAFMAASVRTTPGEVLQPEDFVSTPHRQLGANVETIASYVQPGDTVVDVGGGAGRVNLSLALRCRQVTNVDPSPGMKAEFEGGSR